MPEKKNKNLTLWSSVETTDPEYTTKVNQRGGFTAIGAQYQIKNATETFGPFGSGFGVRNESYTPILGDNLIVYTAEFFYRYKNGSAEVTEGSFPISSSIKTMMGNKIDDDCIKKVATDALTKGLSKLGFNADVFMGRFDDNKYVTTPSPSSQSSGKDGDGWI